VGVCVWVCVCGCVCVCVCVCVGVCVWACVCVREVTGCLLIAAGFVDIARLLCGSGSMKLSCIGLSVCLLHPVGTVRCSRFAAVVPAGRRYRLIGSQQQCASGKCVQCHIVS